MSLYFHGNHMFQRILCVFILIEIFVAPSRILLGGGRWEVEKRKTNNIYIISTQLWHGVKFSQMIYSKSISVLLSRYVQERKKNCKWSADVRLSDKPRVNYKQNRYCKSIYIYLYIYIFFLSDKSNIIYFVAIKYNDELRVWNIYIPFMCISL